MPRFFLLFILFFPFFLYPAGNVVRRQHRRPHREPKSPGDYLESYCSSFGGTPRKREQKRRAATEVSDRAKFILEQPPGNAPPVQPISTNRASTLSNERQLKLFALKQSIVP